MPKRVLNRWKKVFQICNMKSSVFYAIILLLAGCFLFLPPVKAQNWDINFVRKVNPLHPNSFVWKSASTSVYPVSIAAPVSAFIIGEIKKDKQLKINAYENLGSLAICAIATEGLKKSINRQRPYQTHAGIYPYKYESGESFPSGHTAFAFATATTLSLQYKKWYVVVPAYAWAAGCGYSRLYLGEHYVTDVLGGAAIGTGSAFLSHWLSKKVFK